MPSIEPPAHFNHVNTQRTAQLAPAGSAPADDGSYVIKARLSPEHGARIVQALQETSAAIREEQRDATEDVSAQTPIAALRADAPQRIVESYLTGEDVRISGGDTCTLHVHTEIDTLRADGDGAESELDPGSNVSAETCLRSRRRTGGSGWMTGWRWMG